MKQVKYCLIALFTACVVNISFAADETNSSTTTTTADAKPSCGCKGKNAASSEKPAS